MAQLRFRYTQPVLTACLAGEVDHHSAQQLREAIDAAVLAQTPEKLVLDLGGITFMDSSAVGLILGRSTMMRALGGKLVIQRPPAQLRRILQLAQIRVEGLEDEVSIS